MFKIEIDKEIHLELMSPCHAEDFLILFGKNSEHISKWLISLEDNSLERLHNMN